MKEEHVHTSVVIEVGNERAGKAQDAIAPQSHFLWRRLWQVGMFCDLGGVFWPSARVCAGRGSQHLHRAGTPTARINKSRAAFANSNSCCPAGGVSTRSHSISTPVARERGVGGWVAPCRKIPSQKQTPSSTNCAFFFHRILPRVSSSI